MEKSTFNLQRVKKISEELLKKIAPDVEINSIKAEDATIFIEVKTSDPQLFLGQGAEILLAAQHLLRAILRRAFGPDQNESRYVDLDINSYKKKRKAYLKELAVATANEVSLSGKEMFLAPMTAYERRVVHMELSQRVDIATESHGHDPDRRIAVKRRK